MAAGKHVAVWPKVRVFPNGKGKVVARGETLPAGVSPVELDNLVSFGAIAGIREADVPDGAQPDAGQSSEPDEPTTAEEILNAVGDDKTKAAAALEKETGSTKPRSTLVKRLEAIVNGQS